MVTSKSLVTTTSAGSGFGVWSIVSLILAIIGGIVLYFLFTSKKNKGEYKGFLAWLHSFLRFDKMMIEALVKILYLIMAIFITLGSFELIGSSFLLFILTLTLGNVFIRLIFEACIFNIQIWKNTTEIKESLEKKSK